MALFKEHDIDVLTFVSHASHVLQPLDLVPFALFKQLLSKGLSAMKQLTLPAKRKFVIDKAIDALYHALSPHNIAVGFRKAGIYPIDRSVPLNHPAINNDPNTPPVPITRRRTTIILDGDILTSDEAIQRMREDKKRTRERNRQAKKTGRKIAKKREDTTPLDDGEPSMSDYSMYSDD